MERAIKAKDRNLTSRSTIMEDKGLSNALQSAKDVMIKDAIASAPAPTDLCNRPREFNDQMSVPSPDGKPLENEMPCTCAEGYRLRWCKVHGRRRKDGSDEVCEALRAEVDSARGPVEMQKSSSQRNNSDMSAPLNNAQEKRESKETLLRAFRLKIDKQSTEICAELMQDAPTAGGTKDGARISTDCEAKMVPLLTKGLSDAQVYVQDLWQFPSCFCACPCSSACNKYGTSSGLATLFDGRV